MSRTFFQKCHTVAQGLWCGFYTRWYLECAKVDLLQVYFSFIESLHGRSQDTYSEEEESAADTGRGFGELPLTQVGGFEKYQDFREKEDDRELNYNFRKSHMNIHRKRDYEQLENRLNYIVGFIESEISLFDFGHKFRILSYMQILINIKKYTNI